MPDQLLASLLSREITCLSSLLHILKKEYDSLLSGNTDEIEQIALEKMRALDEQSEISKARLEQTQLLVGSDSEEDLEQYLLQNTGLQSSEPPNQLKAYFDEIKSLLTQCQEANRTNGRVINEKQLHTQGALNILRQTENEPPTYSGQGSSNTRQKGRSLGKA